MPKGKRKVKRIGLMERLLNKCGYVRAPKRRAGKVAVKPYNRTKPVAAKGGCLVSDQPPAPGSVATSEPASNDAMKLM